MGVYDNLICKYPLPNPEVKEDTFQTKDFDHMLETYIITKDGRLVQNVPRKDKWVELDLLWEGNVNFYTFTGDKHWYEFNAHFTDGKLDSIQQV